MNLRDGRLLSLSGTVNPSRTVIHLPRLGAAEFYIRLRFGEGPTSGRSSQENGNRFPHQRSSKRHWIIRIGIKRAIYCGQQARGP